MKFENIDIGLEKNKTNHTALRHQAAGIARGEFGQMVGVFLINSDDLIWLVGWLLCYYRDSL